MDVKQMIGAFILVVLAIYVGNMWTHREIKRQEKEAADAALLAAQLANLPPATT